MTPTTDETVGGRGGEGDGLRASGTRSSATADLGVMLGARRSAMPSVGQRKYFPIFRSMINSSERSAAAVGRRPKAIREIPEKRPMAAVSMRLSGNPRLSLDVYIKGVARPER